MQHTPRLCLFFWLFLLPFLSSHAQETMPFVQYYTNLYQINPSYAGIDGQAHASLVYRKQWLGFPGAPSGALLSYHAPLRLHMSYGGQIYNEQQGFLNITNLLGTYAYTIVLKEHEAITFGMSAGVSSTSLGLSELGNITDPALLNAKLGFGILGNAGLNYRKKNMLVGLSLPGLFATNQASSESFAVKSPLLAGGIMFHATDRIYFKRDRYAIEPHVSYRYYLNNPGQFEVGALAHLNHKAWTGLSYRQGLGLAAMAGVKLQNKYMISYSYGVRNFSENSIPYDSHEIQIDLLLGRRLRGREYLSFVDDHKPKRVRKVTTKHKNLAKHMDKIADEHEKSKTVVDTVKITVIDTIHVWKEKMHKARFDVAEHTMDSAQLAQDSIALEMAYQAILAEEAERKAREDSLSSLSVEDKIHHSIITDPEWKEFILDKGFYVVKSQFEKFHDAVAYSDDLLAKGYFTQYGYDVGKRSWYVYTLKTSDKAEAEVELDKWVRKAQFKEAFLIEIE